MNFSKLKLNEAASAPVQKAEADARNSSEKQAMDSQKATTGQLKQRSQKTKPTEAGEVGRDIIGTNEEHLRSLRTQKEIHRLREEQKSDWREELEESLGNEQAQASLPQAGQEPEQEDNHPYVEIMPSTQFKQKEAEAQLKAAAEKEKMNKMASGLRGRAIGEAVTLQETRSDLNQRLKNQAIEDDKRRQKGIRKARKADKKKAVTPEEAGIKAGSEILKRSKAPSNYSG